MADRRSECVVCTGMMRDMVFVNIRGFEEPNYSCRTSFGGFTAITAIDSSTLACGCANEPFSIFMVNPQRDVASRHGFVHHRSRVLSLYLHPSSDGEASRLFSCDRSGELAVWDIEGQTRMGNGQFSVQRGFKTIQMVPHILRKTLVMTNHTTITEVDMQTFAERQTIKCFRGRRFEGLSVIASSCSDPNRRNPGGDRGLIFASGVGKDKVLRLFSLSGGAEVDTVRSNYAIRSLCYFSDGGNAKIMSGQNCGYVEIWDARNLRSRVLQFRPHMKTALNGLSVRRSFVSGICQVDEDLFASCAGDGTVALWNRDGKIRWGGSVGKLEKRTAPPPPQPRQARHRWGGTYWRTRQPPKPPVGPRFLVMAYLGREVLGGGDVERFDKLSYLIDHAEEMIPFQLVFPSGEVLRIPKAFLVQSTIENLDEVDHANLRFDWNVEIAVLLRMFVGASWRLSSLRLLLDYYGFFRELGLTTYCYVLLTSYLNTISRLRLFLSVMKKSLATFGAPEPTEMVGQFQFPSAFTLVCYNILSIRKKDLLKKEKSVRRLERAGVMEWIRSYKPIPIINHPEFDLLRERYADDPPMSFVQVADMTFRELYESRAHADLELETPDGVVVAGHLPILMWKSNFVFQTLSFGGREAEEVAEAGKLSVMMVSGETLTEIVRFAYIEQIESRNLRTLIELLQHGDMFGDVSMLRVVLQSLRTVSQSLHRDGRFVEEMEELGPLVEVAYSYEELVKFWMEIGAVEFEDE